MRHNDRRRRLQILVTALAATLLGAAWLFAQGDAPTGAAPPSSVPETGAINPLTGELPTFSVLFNTSPVINGLIFALSGVSVMLFIFFMATIHPRALAPATFIDDVTKLVVDRQFDQAASYCRNHRHLFAGTVIGRCVENAFRDHATLMTIAESEGQRRANILWNRISYLVDISAVAPMLGLLGTVMGMLQAFFVLPSQSASINSGLLTQAIGGAMATTFFGLIVAIATVIFYSIVKSRTTKTLAEVEQVVHSIADHIKRGEK